MNTILVNTSFQVLLFWKYGHFRFPLTTINQFNELSFHYFFILLIKISNAFFVYDYFLITEKG